MDQRGLMIGRMLDAGLSALAAGTVVRQREGLRDDDGQMEPGLFTELVADTEMRILQLAEALAAGRPRLFVEHIEWSRMAIASRELNERRLRENLVALRDELQRELPPHAHAPAIAVIDEATAVFGHAPRALPSLLEMEVPHRTMMQRFLLAILEARRQDALDLILNQAAEELSVSEIETQILAPVQWEVGRMWQRGELAVHEEHLGSRIVEEALVLLRSKMPPCKPRGVTVLVTSVRGNLHDIGTRIVADHFEMDGWNALCLGANLPGEDLSRAVLDFGSNLVALSVTMSTHLRETATVIEGLRQSLGDHTTPVLVGGPPFDAVPDLWQAVGADGWCDSAIKAPELGRELLGLK